MAVIATHPRATDRNLAAVEADLAFGSAPALPHSSPPRLCGLPPRLLRSMIERISSRSILVPTPAFAVQRALAGFDRLELPLLHPEQFMIADLDCVLDTTRSTEALGWVPHDSDLDMMLDAYARAVSARLMAPA